MALITIPAWSSATPDSGVVRGVAEGLGEIFPVPQHPGSVLVWLGSTVGDPPSGHESSLRDGGSNRDVLHEA
ncbi:hypothetical protein QO012_004440 [Methylobacterium aerolatum]|uniref:Uncharacterized protein n=1 Tax=Methylobacterium aerolatum TaxID=418708 RepID=A0ABU0I5M0_9HYPH|nr:hypothetical protein [Methylobacterium aerolatum]GJD37351.1 hypothetical protein FMGBMHLM_4279 [Methylobacterium aerolatum]